MKRAAIILAVVLIGSFVGIQGTWAVGYERYEVSASEQVESTAGGQSSPSLYKAIRNATFVEKMPIIIDEVALFVKDVLSQFGINNRAH